MTRQEAIKKAQKFFNYRAYAQYVEPIIKAVEQESESLIRSRVKDVLKNIRISITSPLKDEEGYFFDKNTGKEYAEIDSILQCLDNEINNYS